MMTGHHSEDICTGLDVELRRGQVLNVGAHKPDTEMSSASKPQYYRIGTAYYWPEGKAMSKVLCALMACRTTDMYTKTCTPSAK